MVWLADAGDAWLLCDRRRVRSVLQSDHFGGATRVDAPGFLCLFLLRHHGLDTNASGYWSLAESAHEFDHRGCALRALPGDDWRLLRAIRHSLSGPGRDTANTGMGRAYHVVSGTLQRARRIHQSDRAVLRRFCDARY